MNRNPARHPASLAAADILVVPGRGGSGPDHWQSCFERQHANARRVEQDHWDEPDLDRWAQRIAAASHAATRPVLAVAHSFGCLALVHAAAAHGAAIAAALLVAPADPGRFGIALPLVQRRLDAASLLIASSNDPWLRAWQAMDLADRWGSRYLNLGLVGHINVASGFGAWPACDQFAEIVWREAQGDPGNRSEFPLPAAQKATWPSRASAA